MMTRRSALVGREDERAGIEAALARCRAGAGGLVLVSGESGVGKSRLVAEALAGWQSRLLRGSAVAGCRCYGPLLDILRVVLDEIDDAETSPPRVAAALIGSSTVQAQTPPIVLEVLTPRATFTDDVKIQIRNKLDGQATQVMNLDDPSRVVTARVTVQPGAMFPWHTHPGPVMVTVAEGELTDVQAVDCVEREYPARTIFVDPGQGNVHTAFNSSDGVTVLYGTFFDVPADGPLTIPADGPAGCDVAVGSHSH